MIITRPVVTNLSFNVVFYTEGLFIHPYQKLSKSQVAPFLRAGHIIYVHPMCRECLRDLALYACVTHA